MWTKQFTHGKWIGWLFTAKRPTSNKATRLSQDVHALHVKKQNTECTLPAGLKCKIILRPFSNMHSVSGTTGSTGSRESLKKRKIQINGPRGDRNVKPRNKENPPCGTDQGDPWEPNSSKPYRSPPQRSWVEEWKAEH